MPADYNDRSALLIRGGALGDFVLTLPVVDALRANFGRTGVLANRPFTELLDKNVAISGSPDDAELAPFFTNSARLTEKYRGSFSAYDLVISYVHDPGKVFETNVRRCGVSNFLVGPSRLHGKTHATEQLAAPLAELGIAVRDFAPRIALSDAECQTGRTLSGQRTARLDSPRIAIHPGSGSVSKNWPLGNWLFFLERLLQRDYCAVIVGGEADYDQVTSIRAQFGDSVSYAIDWPPRALAALLAGTVFIGHDTGVSHLAAASGARCLVLFGPSDPNVWAPRNENARVVVAPGRDLNRLSVTAVEKALRL